MKTLVVKTLSIILLFGVLSCQKDDDSIFEEVNKESLVSEPPIDNTGKSSTNFICSGTPLPQGYRIIGYFNTLTCTGSLQSFPGGYNAALIKPIGTPTIIRAGAGCDDQYCIWIVGEDFEPNAYIDIRTTTGQSIIGTYRGADRQININPQGDDTMSLRLRTAFERNEFARKGLRIWVVNPEARTWADGRTVKRPRDIIDPPCNPICP